MPLEEHDVIRFTEFFDHGAYRAMLRIPFVVKSTLKYYIIFIDIKNCEHIEMD